MLIFEKKTYTKLIVTSLILYIFADDFLNHKYSSRYVVLRVFFAIFGTHKTSYPLSELSSSDTGWLETCEADIYINI